MAISMLLVAATASTSVALSGPIGTLVSPTSVPAAPVDSAAPTGAAQRWIPLLTGDQVAVNAEGEIVSTRPAKGREGIPVLRETLNGHTYAVPADARRLIQSGRLDRRLFDITTLSSPAYAQRQDLRLIVRYDTARPAARTALRAGARTQRPLNSINADALTAPAGDAQLWSTLTTGPASAANRGTAPGIASVWLDAVVEVSLDKSVPQIGGPQAWKAGLDGTGSRIAVLDTGIDATHPDLAGQVVAERNFTDSPDTLDRLGHGTHVASTAAGTGAKSGGLYKGVAPGARILNAKVLGDRGFGAHSGIIAGMEWAVAEKADVVNLSLGGTDTPGVDPVEEAVNNLSAETGTLFVIAAGNLGSQGAGSIGSPGSADAALTVGAVDKQDRLASFSSIGPRVGDGAIKPDLTAPGVDIGAARSKDGGLSGAPVADGYFALSGTSMATPHVSGAAAILAQQHPDWSGEDIKHALTASATPSAYTVFQQGAGRADLGAAIQQSAVTRQTSLPFGTAQWPHADDEPITKDLTYRNLGSTPLTLKLTTEVTGPDGVPAPDGMFTVDEQVTIAPGGEKTVKVTADTRIGDRTGLFSGRVKATGGGQTVRTPLVVELEAEMYTLTVKALDRAGKPAAPSWWAAVAGLSGTAEGDSSYLHDGSSSMRLPKGRYFLSATLPADPAGSFSQGVDFINQPRLDLTRDTTVTLDGRTTKPFDITVPNRSAYPVAADTSVFSGMTNGKGAGFGIGITTGTTPDIDPHKAIRTAHLGPEVNLQEQHLRQNLGFSFSTGAKGRDEYHLLYLHKSDTVTTGFTRHTKRHDFANVDVTMGATAKNKFGLYTPGISEVGGGYATAHPLPYTGTVHLLGPSNTWRFGFSQANSDVRPEASYTNTSADVFKPGRTYRRTFNMGVFGPDLRPGFGIIREGAMVNGALPMFSDNAGNHNDNNSVHSETSTTLHRNGELVYENTATPAAFHFVLDDERADYRLTASIARAGVSDVSTRVTASWTFSSEYTAEPTLIPLSVVRFTPELSLDNTARAGAKMKVPVSVKGAAEGRNLKSLSVRVSYDQGAHWHKLTVRDGAVQVTNPRAGGSVSFKAVAVDKQGNSVEQTINDAYLTH
ncbi:S8 family serine peptidase [Streptomyces cadmiisoli]|uniref:S8 family serine peptidase n=1 Tax=Streptomyces cadmiisoli TaxID=2184053 RepID=UPI003D71F2A8